MLHSTSGTLTPRAPFDFDKSLQFINRFGPMAGEQAVGERALTKAVFSGGQAIVFRLESTGGVEQPQLAYTLHAERAIDAATYASPVESSKFKVKS